MPKPKTIWWRHGNEPVFAGPGDSSSTPSNLIPGTSALVAPSLRARLLDTSTELAAALDVWLQKRPGPPRTTWSGVDASGEAIPYLLEALLCAEQIRIEVLDHMSEMQNEGQVDLEVSAALNEIMILQSSLAYALPALMKIHAHLWGVQTGQSSFLALRRKTRKNPSTRKKKPDQTPESGPSDSNPPDSEPF